MANTCGKLRAALDVRASANALILARTDALAVEDIAAMFECAGRYLECGVDALFIEALRMPEQMDTAFARFAHRIPHLANMAEGGKTPVQPVAELQRRRFRMAIFRDGTVRPLAHTLQGYYASLHARGSTEPWRERIFDFDGVNAVIGTPELMTLGRRHAGGEEV